MRYCAHSFLTFNINILLTVTLSGQHPEEKPTFTFQSVYHEDGSGKPYEKVITDYPYSPRWKGTEMAERARLVLFMYDYIKY